MQGPMDSDADVPQKETLPSSTRQACFNMAVDFADLLLILLHRTVCVCLYCVCVWGGRGCCYCCLYVCIVRACMCMTVCLCRCVHCVLLRGVPIIPLCGEWCCLLAWLCMVPCVYISSASADRAVCGVHCVV